MKISPPESHQTPEGKRSVGPAMPRRSFRIGRLGVAIALCALAVLGVLGLKAGGASVPDASSKAPAAIELLPSDLGKATLQEMQRSIPLTGTLQPLNQTEVKTQQAGEILEVLVREGEPVRRGQIVAKLDGADLAARLQDKQGALEVGVAQRELARSNLAKNASLLKENFISQAAFDNIRNSHQVSEATLVSLRAQVQQARKALAEAVIRSPIDGVIAERVAQPGLAVASNTKLFTVQDLTVMNVEAPVPASDIPSVKVGQEASLNIEGFGDRVFVGKVDRINPSTEKNSRSIIVHLRVANADDQLRGGMFTQGTLGVARPISAVVVPKAAIRTRNGRTVVLRIEAGKLVEQEVTVGMTDPLADTVEIRVGLSAGAEVVVGSISNLADGQSIRIAAIPPLNQ